MPPADLALLLTALACLGLRLGGKFFIQANQEQEKLRTLLINMAHLNGL